MPVFRGEVYYVYLDPVFGHEMGGYKVRPVAVISLNDLNNRDGVITVVPGTTASTKPTHFRNVVLVKPSPKNGLQNDTVFDCRHLRGIDKGRLISRPAGQLSSEDLLKVEEAVKYCLGFFADPPRGNKAGR